MKTFDGDRWNSPGSSEIYENVPNNISEYTDRLRPLINVPARPIGSLWPQGLSYDDEEEVFYVYYSGTVDSVYAHRLSKFSRDGDLIEYKYTRSSDNNPDVPLTSSESIPFWKEEGKMYFLLSAASNGRDRYIYNWTDGVLESGPFTILGGYRGDFDGEYYVTSDSNDSTSGVSRIYYYSKESIKSGTPELVRSVPLQYRSRNRKLQGLTTYRGVTLGLTGPTATIPGIIGWASNGNQIYSYEYSRQELGALVNEYWPETIVDLTNYHSEAESMYASENGKLVWGSVINNGGTARYIVFEAGRPEYKQISTLPDVESVDTDWIPLEITNPDFFEPYQGSSRFEIRRSGVIVMLRGELRTKQDAWSGQKVASIAGMGRGFIPLMSNSSMQVGSGNGRFCCSVNSAGDVTLTRADSALNVSNQWLNINVMYMTD